MKLCQIQVDYDDVAPYSKIKVPGYDKLVEFGVLTSFAYTLEEPYTDASGKQISEIVVATTRPETMIGDTGIAVHPDDLRYFFLIVPSIGPSRSRVFLPVDAQ